VTNNGVIQAGGGGAGTFLPAFMRIVPSLNAGPQGPTGA